MLRQQARRVPCRSWRGLSSSSSPSSPPSSPSSCSSVEAAPADEALSAPWLFVGLGNPGPKYEGTRHNIGFEMIDAVSRNEGITLNAHLHKCLLGEGTIAGTPVVLIKPQTYANLSGEAVAPLAKHYGVRWQRVVVICDATDLRVAKLSLLRKGGHGDHKGLVNIIDHWKGCRLFPRLRVGIGPPPGKMATRAFVLQKFCNEERELMNVALNQGVQVIRLIAASDIQGAIENMSKLRRFQTLQKD